MILDERRCNSSARVFERFRDRLIEDKCEGVPGEEDEETRRRSSGMPANGYGATLAEFGTDAERQPNRIESGFWKLHVSVRC